MNLGHYPDAVINDQRLADDPRGRIGTKKLDTVCHLLGRNQAPCRGAANGLGDTRFAVRHCFPYIREHRPGR